MLSAWRDLAHHMHSTWAMPSSRCPSALVVASPSLLASFFVGVALIVAGCGGRVDTGASSDVEPSGAGRGESPGSGSSSSGTVICTAIPSCESSDQQIGSESECPQDGICYPRSMCGQTIWCISAVTTCAAIPVCPDGSRQVKHCPASADCFSVTMCNATIQCQKGCEGPQPICDAGDTQVAGPSACLQDDAVCYSRSTCGVTIWCTGPSD